MSDTHGVLPTPLDGDWDCILHTGDMLPNRSYGIRPLEITFQQYWLEENAPKFHPRYWDKPVFYVPGNHDYIDPTRTMRDLGIDARLVCNERVEFMGANFYGFPWTPTFYDWNWMCGPLEMEHHLQPAIELMEQGALDVFLAHGPMYGVRDRNAQGERCGSKVVRRVMQDVRHPPKVMMHGHIHESRGTQAWARGIMVSNAATTQQIVELT